MVRIQYPLVDVAVGIGQSFRFGAPLVEPHGLFLSLWADEACTVPAGATADEAGTDTINGVTIEGARIPTFWVPEDVGLVYAKVDVYDEVLTLHPYDTAASSAALAAAVLAAIPQTIAAVINDPTSLAAQAIDARVDAESGGVLVVDNGNGTVTVTTHGVGFVLTDNHNGTATLTLNGSSVTFGTGTAQESAIAALRNITDTVFIAALNRAIAAYLNTNGPIGGLVFTDNGDGTATASGTSVVDNGDGTALVYEDTVTDNIDGTATAA